jgi:ubiquinone/menaquinone biosynthesis C-methylase UbiE
MRASEYSSAARALLAADAPAADYELRARKRDMQFFAQFLRALPINATRALDVGCGAGRLTAALGARVAWVTGVDISPTMLELARERAPQLHWIRADADALPFAAASFDFVVSSSALRLTHLEHSLPQIERVLRPGGALAIRDVQKSAAQKASGAVGYTAWVLRRAFDAWRVLGHAIALNLLRTYLAPTTRAFHRAAVGYTPAETRAGYEAAFPGCQWSWETDAFFVTWTKPGKARVG